MNPNQFPSSDKPQAGRRPLSFWAFWSECHKAAWGKTWGKFGHLRGWGAIAVAVALLLKGVASLVFKTGATMSNWIAIIPVSTIPFLYFVYMLQAAYSRYIASEEKTTQLSFDVERLKASKLNLLCDMGNALCNPSVPQGANRYLRVVVSTESIKGVLGCKCDLMCIRIGEVEISKENWHLTFEPSGGHDTCSKEILHGGQFPLDILAITQNNDIWIMTHPKASPAIINRDPSKPIFSQHGKYILEISVMGILTSSAKEELEFEWDGKWDTAKLSLIPKKKI